jgi:hypothetical protein
MKSIFLPLALILVSLVVALALECNNSSDDNLVSKLLHWLRENGAYINKKVVVRRVVSEDPLSSRGIFATDDMAVGEIVCRIPWNLILKPSEEDLGTWEDCGTIKACRDRSRSVSEIYRPLALARLYSESWIWYSLGIVCIKTMRANLWKKVSFAESLEGRIFH